MGRCPHLSLDRFEQRGHTDDVQDARQIVGQDAQRHLGGDLGKRLHQEVSCAHAHLHGPERVLGGLTPRAHSARIFVEPLLHRLEYILVLPARDAALWAWRAAAFERAFPTDIGPIAVQLQPVLFARKTVCKFQTNQAPF